MNTKRYDDVLRSIVSTVLRCTPDMIHWVNATVADYLTKDPKTTREAYMAPDCDQWKKAMSEEFESFLKMSVLEPLTP